MDWAKPYWRIILAKGQLNHSYTIWTLSILPSPNNYGTPSIPFVETSCITLNSKIVLNCQINCSSDKDFFFLTEDLEQYLKQNTKAKINLFTWTRRQHNFCGKSQPRQDFSLKEKKHFIKINLAIIRKLDIFKSGGRKIRLCIRYHNISK